MNRKQRYQLTKERRNMTIKELEKEIREKITVLDKDELKKIIKYIDELCNDDVVEYNNTINHLTYGKH